MAQPNQEEGSNIISRVSARDLSIWGARRTQYWKWKTIGNGSDPNQVAELIKVIYLQIVGDFDDVELTEEVKYEVNFEVVLKDDFFMNGPVTLALLHDTKITRTEDLTQKQKNQVIKLKVGEFTAKSDFGVKFAMWNLTGSWKKGLVVHGASISKV